MAHEFIRTNAWQDDGSRTFGIQSGAALSTAQKNNPHGEIMPPSKPEKHGLLAVVPRANAMNEPTPLFASLPSPLFRDGTTGQYPTSTALETSFCLPLKRRAAGKTSHACLDLFQQPRWTSDLRVRP